mgnify:FL=1
MQNTIQKASAAKQSPAPRSINQIINGILDGEAMRKRFDELLGKRSPQFISSLVTLINATPQLQQAIYEAPMTVIQAALKAATYDLPIDPALGYAYIVPFNNSVKEADGTFHKRMEAAFILGYKGMNQLAMRTGAYKTINVMDVREGELKSYNRLTEEISIEFIEDEDAREATPVVGYVGYFKLINGTEKTIYMTRKQIEAHEKKHRKGKYMGKGWQDDFEAMAQKTVYRRLIGKWGLMSIDYQTADAATIAAAEAIATGNFDDDSMEGSIIDAGTGEVIDVTDSVQEVEEDTV